jgi:hypothetical protein
LAAGRRLGLPPAGDAGAIVVEMEQLALQKLLYDLKAGMPLLFADQLDVPGSADHGGPMKAAGADQGGVRRVWAMAGK